MMADVRIWFRTNNVEHCDLVRFFHSTFRQNGRKTGGRSKPHHQIDRVRLTRDIVLDACREKVAIYHLARGVIAIQQNERVQSKFMPACLPPFLQEDDLASSPQPAVHRVWFQSRCLPCTRARRKFRGESFLRPVAVRFDWLSRLRYAIGSLGNGAEIRKLSEA